MNPEDARMLKALLEEQERLRSRVDALGKMIVTFQEKVASRQEAPPAPKALEEWEQPRRVSRIDVPPVVPETAPAEKAEVLIPPPLPAAAVSAGVASRPSAT